MHGKNKTKTFFHEFFKNYFEFPSLAFISSLSLAAFLLSSSRRWWRRELIFLREPLTSSPEREKDHESA